MEACGPHPAVGHWVWSETDTALTPAAGTLAGRSEKGPESDRISLVKGEQMEVSSRGRALRGPGSAPRGWSGTCEWRV